MIHDQDNDLGWIHSDFHSIKGVRDSNLELYAPQIQAIK